MTSAEILDLSAEDTSTTSFVFSSTDLVNISLNGNNSDLDVDGSDRPVSPMGLAGIVATSIILGVMTLTTIVGITTFIYDDFSFHNSASQPFLIHS